MRLHGFLKTPQAAGHKTGVLRICYGDKVAQVSAPKPIIVKRQL
jgi:hypothetical protein